MKTNKRNSLRVMAGNSIVPYEVRYESSTKYKERKKKMEKVNTVLEGLALSLLMVFILASAFYAGMVYQQEIAKDMRVKQHKMKYKV